MTAPADLPAHPTLRHPITGLPLRAAGVVNGRTIWPVLGGSGEATQPPGQPAAPAAQGTQPPGPQTAPALGSQPQPPAPPQSTEPAAQTGDAPLGEGGKKALEAERAARKELEKKLAALAPLEELAAKLGAVPAAKLEDDTADRVAALEKLLTEERTARVRLEVAKAKGLTDAQAAELVGDTVEALTAHADRLLAAFPAASQANGQGQQTPPAPKPDPTQGARGQIDLDAQIADAEAKGDHMRAIALKRRRMFQNRT